jgi:hypothetical protein
VVAAVTAAIVFVIGQQLFPVKPRQAPPPVAPTTAPETPPPPPIAAAADAASLAAAAGDAGTKAAKAPDAVADAGAAAKTEKQAAAEPVKPAAEPAAEDETDAAAAERKVTVADKQRQADKDLAREAWRRNRPDISVAGSKTSILVPIKGSIKGSEFKILRKSRTVVVTLPKAVSMVTMRVYTLKHPSFKKLWIDQDEANAQPADGTKLRFIFSQTLDPQVEITEDFVRVTIRRPEPTTAPAERERAEKRSEPADEAAAPDKEKD